jgi:response regulator RpfG family c-di-GMP phosphodiesterase
MKTILFIDDDIGPLQYLVDIFKMKYNVITADNINTAFDKLSDYRLHINLIITDWHLGDDVTAQQIFKVIKESKNDQYSKMPIIVVSSDEDNKRWIEKQGANFLRKPAKPSDILQVVKEKIGE